MLELYQSMFGISVRYWNLLSRIHILNVNFQNWLLIFAAFGFLVVVIKSMSHMSGGGVTDAINKTRDRED